MPPSHRIALVGPRLGLAALLCVAGVLAILLVGASTPSASRSGPAVALVYSAVLPLTARGPALGSMPAAASAAKSTAILRDSAARLAGDTPDGRDDRASRRASGLSPRAARHHERPLDAACTTDLDVVGRAPVLASSRLYTAIIQSSTFARARGKPPSSIERDVHAPRGPPSNPSA
jgi:hypothetical protein